MADFCADCSVEKFGKDFRDLAGLCNKGEMAGVICEGCGWIFVDEDGVKVSEVEVVEEEESGQNN